MKLGRKANLPGRLLVACHGDHHAGHVLGLLNPDAVLVRVDPDGQPFDHRPEGNEWTREGWRTYLAHRAALDELAGGDPVDEVVGGDVCNGDKYPDGCMDVTAAEQVDLAVWNMAPAGNRRVEFVTGTGAHSRLGRATAEAKVAARLPSARCAHHSRLRYWDQWIDAAHHGPGKGIRFWLDGNNARYYLRDRVLRDACTLGVLPATVYLRFHHHVWCHEVLEVPVGGKVHLAHLVVVPGYCGMSEYARQRTGNLPHVENGMAILEFVGGELSKVHKFTDVTDLRVERVMA